MEDEERRLLRNHASEIDDNNADDGDNNEVRSGATWYANPRPMIPT